MMAIEEIRTGAAAAAGPYSQAVKAGDYIFVSGQVPIDTATGKVIDGDIRAQAARVFDGAEAILKAAGVGLDRVVRAEIYLTDITDLPSVNEIYSSKFHFSVKPARHVVGVSALPRNVKIEFACTAYTGK
jgi:2-iminobutanoate/2-iminopropanoate deaminase